MAEQNKRCPYICKSKTETECWNQHPDDNGNVTKGITVRQYFFEYEECLKENCGAWYDGKCHYQGNN